MNENTEEEHIMPRTARVFLVAMALLLAGAAAAWADTCYQAAGLEGLVLVLKNFTQPGTPNTCDKINGYLAFTRCPLSGNACRGADNDVVIFQAESRVSGCLIAEINSFEISWLIFPSTQTGILFVCLDGTLDCIDAPVEKVVCPPTRPFAPGPS